jgi:cyanophycinase-like exopeptidase
MSGPDRKVMNELVSGLGRVVADVHSADREAPELPVLGDAHRHVAEATELIVELARGSDDESAIVTRAWAAIAAAQDAAVQARAAITSARRDREKLEAIRRRTQEQAARARVHAARIRWSWNSRFPNDD